MKSSYTIALKNPATVVKTMAATAITTTQNMTGRRSRIDGMLGAATGWRFCGPPPTRLVPFGRAMLLLHHQCLADLIPWRLPLIVGEQHDQTGHRDNKIGDRAKEADDR